MKKCPSCGKTKDWSEFHRNRNEEDGRHTYCKICMRPRLQEYKKARSDHNRKLIYRYLRFVSCQRCGYKNPIALEFAHRQDKKRDVMRMVRDGYTLKTIKEEIRKCDVICANCHKLETYKDSWRANAG